MDPLETLTLIITKEPAGKVSPEECYVCIHNWYIYTGRNLNELFEDMNKNWESENAMIGCID